jgi:hypothetical protein
VRRRLSKQPMAILPEALIPSVIDREQMDKLQERAMGFIPPKIPKKKISFRKKKSKSAGSTSSSSSAILPYKGYAGVEVVESYLMGIDWERDRGVLVISKENYFFGLVYANVGNKKERYVYFPEVDSKNETVTALKYPVQVVRLVSEYFNAIQVKSLKEAGGLRGFVFCSPEAIEEEAQQYVNGDQYYYSNLMEKKNLQSEYSLGQVEYDQFQQLKAIARRSSVPAVSENSIMVDSVTGKTMKYTNGEWKEVVKLKKWKKKEEAERQLIF